MSLFYSAVSVHQQLLRPSIFCKEEHLPEIIEKLLYQNITIVTGKNSDAA